MKAEIPLTNVKHKPVAMSVQHECRAEDAGAAR
jgi:hypothetical protein